MREKRKKRTPRTPRTPRENKKPVTKKGLQLKAASAMTLFVAGVMLTGCARFSTTQRDVRYGEDGKPATEIVTKAGSWTFFSSKSALANFTATQSEKSQGASVGCLTQQGATNSVAFLRALAELLAAMPK